MPAPTTPSVKCVVTGDGTVGKTCMLVSYSTNTFPTEYVPTVFNNYTKSMLINGKPVKLGLWDTAGQEDYDRLRPLSYTKADILLICFSLDSPTTLANVKSKWVPEAQQYAPTAPFILVGTKKDIRDKSNGPEDTSNMESEDSPKEGRNSVKNFISQAEGQNVAQQVGALAYLECSALTQEGLKQVFDVAVRSSIGRKQQSQACCIVM